MSSKAGSVLVGHQGCRARLVEVGGVVAELGIGISAALWTRLRAWPTAMGPFAVSIATSMPYRAAYRATICPALDSRSVVNTISVPGFASPCSRAEIGRLLRVERAVPQGFTFVYFYRGVSAVAAYGGRANRTGGHAGTGAASQVGLCGVTVISPVW